MKTIVNDEFRSLGDFIKSLPETFESGGTTLYKARNTVKKFTCDGIDLIVKRYKRPNAVQRVVYTLFRPSKAARAYSYANILLDRGYATPTPIAYIEIKKGGLINECYFISTVTTDTPLYDALVETPDFDRELAAKLAQYVAQMHIDGVMHGDPNLNNILYNREEDGTTHFTLIDTNRSTFKSNLSKSSCISNLVRLTHRRDLLEYLISRYAEYRKWDVDDTVRRVIDGLDKFEHRREVKYRLKQKYLK